MFASLPRRKSPNTAAVMTSLKDVVEVDNDPLIVD